MGIDLVQGDVPRAWQGLLTLNWGLDNWHMISIFGVMLSQEVGKATFRY